MSLLATHTSHALTGSASRSIVAAAALELAGTAPSSDPISFITSKSPEDMRPSLEQLDIFAARISEAASIKLKGQDLMRKLENGSAVVAISPENGVIGFAESETLLPANKAMRTYELPSPFPTIMTIRTYAIGDVPIGPRLRVSADLERALVSTHAKAIEAGKITFVGVPGYKPQYGITLSHGANNRTLHIDHGGIQATIGLRD